MNREIIALRNGFVQIPDFKGEIKPTHVQVVMSTQAELMKLGYMLSQEAVNSLNEVGTAQVIKFHNRTIGYLKDMLGVGNYRPFYVNFPTQVMELSDVELFVNAVIHYWSNGTWEPAQELKARGVKFENVNFKVLSPVTGDEWLRQIARELASFTKPLDETRLKDLVWIAKNVPNVEVGAITVKETLCTLAGEGIAVKVTSPIDVLRVASYLSGGDIALPSLPKPNKIHVDAGHRRSYVAADRKREAEALRETFKFKKFNRTQRKYLLSMIEGLKTIDTSEMARHLGRWIRLGEILHPGEFAGKFPRAFEAFNKLRNEKVRTFAGMVDVAFKSSAEEGLSILKTRPGEFARRLDALVRQYDSLVLPHFKEVADRVSGKVVFEMFDHFEARRKPQASRSVMLKNGKMQVLPALPAISAKTVNGIQDTILKSLKKRFAKLDPMGKVYLDEELKNIPVPFSMQSSSEGVATYSRGTRFAITETTKCLRAFVHWYDQYGSIDIDLGGGFYDDELNVIEHISFYNLRNSKMGTVHSGDVRHRQGHCAEYIDVPLDKVRKNGVRYVIFNAYNYNGGSISGVPECTFGVMEREYPGSNEIFDPKTITSAMKLTAKSNSVVPVAFDLDRNQWIWMDLEHDQRGVAGMWNDTGKKQLEAILGGSKLSIYDLLKMHVEARGEMVTDPEEAEVKFMESDFRTNYTKLTPFMAV